MNVDIDKEELNELLEGFGKLAFKERKNPTFLEIIKQPARETAWSNILAFYFDPNNDHKLGDLMLKSFFEALRKSDEIKNYVGVKVHTEFSTDSRKRIDLLITGTNFVLGIENKVDYWLHNDLEDYSQKIERHAEEKGKGCIAFKVILSKNHYHDERGFVNLTYDSFIKSIKINLQNYEPKADNKYLTFLNDFLANIENTINLKEMIENKKSLEYFQKNYNSLNELTTRFEKTKEQVNQKFIEIQQIIDLTGLNNSLKIRYGESAHIYKTDIENHDGPIFWISISNGDRYVKIEIAIYSFNIYCDSSAVNISFINYAKDKNDEFIESLLESNGLKKLNLDISEDIKTTSAKILNYVTDIWDKIIGKLLSI